MYIYEYMNEYMNRKNMYIHIGICMYVYMYVSVCM